MNIQELADYIFGEFIPRDFWEKFEKDIWGKKLTVRDRFVSYFEKKKLVPRYNREVSEIVLMEIAEKHFPNENSFLNYSKNEDGSLNFDFSIFEPLFRKMNFFEESSIRMR